MTPRRIVCRVCGEVVPLCTLPVDECADCYGETDARHCETPGVVPGVRSAVRVSEAARVAEGR